MTQEAGPVPVHPRAPEPDLFGHETYLSPYTFRYAEEAMRHLWSQGGIWKRVRRVWNASSETLNEAGLVSDDKLKDLLDNEGNISVERIFALEKQSGHDIDGAAKEYGEVALIGGDVVHAAMTSEDPLGNSEVMGMHLAMDIIRDRVVGALHAFGPFIEKYKDLVCVGWTHLQAAEPTTMGYRFARYAQDLNTDLEIIDALMPLIKGKGIRGPVGTAAAMTTLLEGSDMDFEEYEHKTMKRLGIEAADVSGQTYPRKNLFIVESILAGIGQSLHAFALDIQMLQASAIDEVSEPRRRGQVGSSAMPHKRNPIISENVDSITEELPGKLMSAWMTAAFVTLERTLRDSAGKRSWLPESFLIVDEALIRTERIMSGITVHENSIRTNLEKFAPFFVTEKIMAKMIKAGIDRKVAHEILVEHSEVAVDAKREGKPNPMRQLLSSDQRIIDAIGQDGIAESFDEIYEHIGQAVTFCDNFLLKRIPQREDTQQAS